MNLRRSLEKVPFLKSIVSLVASIVGLDLDEDVEDMAEEEKFIEESAFMGSEESGELEEGHK